MSVQDIGNGKWRIKVRRKPDKKRIESNTVDCCMNAIDVHIIPSIGNVLLPDVDGSLLDDFFAALPEDSLRVNCKKTLSAAFD